jgi:hypothetical protein
MENVKASSKAIKNLELALKHNRIDHFTFNKEKEQIENKLSSIYDDESTCTSGIRSLFALFYFDTLKKNKPIRTR